MKKMTIADLAVYLKTTSVRNIVFKTAHQKWYDDFGIYPVQNLQFTEAVVCVNPNCVMLRGAGSKMVFNNLKYASVADGGPDGGIVITLAAEDFYHPDKDTEYCLIAS